MTLITSPTARAAAGLATALLLAAPAAHAQSDWRVCAQENQTCRIDGEALVRFGTDGRWAFRVAKDRIDCEVDDFGDPAPGQIKRCEASVRWRDEQRYRHWNREGWAPRDGWVFCSYEGEWCKPPGPARIRYGAEGRYAEREANGAVRCSNAIFGDPLRDVAKACEYRLAPSAALPANLAPQWQPCAPEGQRCAFRGAAVVRYGGNGRWVMLEDRDGIACRNEAFGVDPLPGQVKRCELLTGLR